MSPSRPALAWYLAAVVCAGVIGAPGPVYWDSFPYVTQALTGDIGGLGVGRLLRSELHGVGPADPLSVVLGTALLVSVALASSFLPAWRASRVDPAIALRDE